jgi:3-oxoacyl-[acyl-carrier-protein] synthase-1
LTAIPLCSQPKVLDIIAMGVASSLGDLQASCAAFRARMSRPSPLVDVAVPDTESGEPVVVMGHPADALTFGFSGTGRLAALLADAIRDLKTRIELPNSWGQVGVVIALPAPDERSFSLLTDPAEEDERPQEEQRQELAQRILRIAGDVNAIGFDTRNLHVVAGGQAGFAAALAKASAELQTRKHAAVLVCAVDSLLSEVTIAQLIEDRRLKTPDSPVGFAPGEAAVVAWVEQEQSVPHRRSGGPMLPVRQIALGKESRPRGSEIPTDGKALTRCALEALQGWAPAKPPIPVLISDHDGESYRALELAMVMVNLQGHDPKYSACPTWLPSTSFGNVGTASAGLALAIARQSLVRAYAPSDNFLLLSSSDGHERAAIHLIAPSSLGRT